MLMNPNKQFHLCVSNFLHHVTPLEYIQLSKYQKIKYSKPTLSSSRQFTPFGVTIARLSVFVGVTMNVTWLWSRTILKQNITDCLSIFIHIHVVLMVLNVSKLVYLIKMRCFKDPSVYQPWELTYHQFYLYHSLRTTGVALTDL